MKNEKQMTLPTGCVTVAQDEMQYIEGGKAITIETLKKYLNRQSCMTTATDLKKRGYCVNMSITQIAQEIHGHAFYGYNGAKAAKLAMDASPLVSAAIMSIAKKGLDGISLGDNCDVWYRVAAYKACW